jgi:hypothetical protein
VYFHYGEHNFIVDISTLRTYLVSDFSPIELNKLVNTFTLHKAKKKVIGDISMPNLLTIKKKNDMNIRIGKNKEHFIKLIVRDRSICINSNGIDQETCSGILIDKTSGYEIPMLFAV